jgi:hypothetical protein
MLDTGDKLKLSTTDHAQPDGQMEIININQYIAGLRKSISG